EESCIEGISDNRARKEGADYTRKRPGRPKAASLRVDRLFGSQHRIERVEHLATAEDQLPAVPAQLAPEPRGADTSEEQRAYFCGVVTLLEMAHVALHLDALTEGADGVLVKPAKGGDHVFVGQPEMVDLLLDLVQTAADDLQHVAALVQLPLQPNHRQCIAQRFTLQAVGIALQSTGKRTVTVT